MSTSNLFHAKGSTYINKRLKISLVCSSEFKPELRNTAGHQHGVTWYIVDIIKLWLATDRAKNVPSQTEVQHLFGNNTYRIECIVVSDNSAKKKTQRTSNSTNDRVIIPRIIHILVRDFNTVHPKQIEWNSCEFDCHGSL